MLDRVTKVIGADFELANSIVGDAPQSARRAATELLAEIDGFPTRWRGGTSIEYGRRFLSTCGSSWYIDSDHLEGNLPEHTSAFDHPNILHGAGFAEAHRAQIAVQSRLSPRARVNLSANCSDGRTAWGSHLNILLTRRCFEDILYRKPHQASFVATHLVTSVIYTGQGLVGSGNGRPACPYQLSQRADWFERFYGLQTMFERPLINLRDESHAGEQLARFHGIYLDQVLCPIANTLKVGTVQLVLAMIEQGWMDPTVCLDDPIAAASQVSRDIKLQSKLRTVVRGRNLSAVEIQLALANLSAEFVASGEAHGIVPCAQRIVDLWIETLDMLTRRDVEALAKRCDAWLKYLLLDRQRGRRGLSWASDEVRVADSLFASLDPEVSLFFQVAANGFIERMPDSQTVARYLLEPPDDTRAYFRAHMLRRYGDEVSAMDWSNIRFRIVQSPNWWSVAEVNMPDPRRFNRAETEALLDDCDNLEELVDAANAMAHDHARDTLMNEFH